MECLNEDIFCMNLNIITIKKRIKNNFNFFKFNCLLYKKI